MRKSAHGMRSALLCLATALFIVETSTSAIARDANRPSITTKTLQSIVQNVNLLTPPVAIPPIVESDYVKYFGDGTGQLVVPMVLTLRNGTKVLLADPHLVTAYPDTPFTRWMIEAYSQHVNGTYLNGEFNMYPGQQKSGITVPAYLDHDSSIYTPGRSAVKIADRCDPNGNCYFYHLPPGNYFVFENAFVSEDRSEFHSYLEPYLDYIVEHQFTTTRSVPVGGFVVVGGVYKVSKDEQSRATEPVNATAFYYLDVNERP